MPGKAPPVFDREDAIVAALEADDLVAALAAYAPSFVADAQLMISPDLDPSLRRKIAKRLRDFIEAAIAAAQAPGADAESIDSVMAGFLDQAYRSFEEDERRRAANLHQKAEILRLRSAPRHGAAPAPNAPDRLRGLAPPATTAEAMRIRQKRGRHQIPAQPEPEIFLTRPEAARLIRKSVGHLDLLRKKNQGPGYFKSGRSILYKKAEVLAWMEANMVRAPEI